MHLRTVAVITALLCLSACGKSNLPPLPEGPITATGTLVSTDVALKRRGTHLLTVNGTNLYYVESSTLSLKQYEGQSVGLQGTLSYNTDPKDLPVLRVTHVTAEKKTGEQISLSSFSVKLTLPSGWTHTTIAGAEVFSASGSVTPLLRIEKSTQLSLPDGVSLLLGGRKAVRTLNADGTETYFIDGPSGIISVLAKIPDENDSKEAVLRDMSLIMRSMQFFGGVASSKSMSLGAGSSAISEAARMPCGGPAGILCAAGSVCIITDAASNIGYCKQIKQ